MFALLGATAAVLLARGWDARVVDPAQPDAQPSEPRLVQPLAAAPSPSPQEPVSERLDPSFDRDQAMPVRARAVASYTMRAALDPVAHTIVGTSNVRWTNASTQPVRELYLHLYLNAFKSERTTFMAQRVPGGRGTGALLDAGHLTISELRVPAMSEDNLWPWARPADPTNPDDETDMRVPLPAQVAPDSEIEIEVKWQAKLPAIVERSGYWGTFHMVGQWFPKVAKLQADGTFAHFAYHHLGEFYADYGDYDVTIEVPSRFMVGATGERVGDTIDGDRRVVRHVQRDVHDFAFAAWDGFEEHVADAGGVSIRCLVPRGYGRAAAKQIEAATFGLQYFAAKFGAYPYATLTIVHPPTGAEEAGGMEYPTLITTGGPWYEPSWVGVARSLTLHELAHQYFYGLVGTDEATWPMLDEGLATLAEVDALQAGWGAGAALRVPGLSLSAFAVLRGMGLQGGQDAVIAQPARSFSSARTYGTLVYARTALLLETVGRAYGDGIQGTVGRYARRYRYGHPGPSHLLGAVRDVLGDAAAEALRVGLFDRGWVDFAISDMRCDAERDGSGQHRCELVMTRRGNLRLPVQVDLLLEDGTRQRITWEGLEPQELVVHTGRSPVIGVIVDPEHRIMLDEDLANNAMTTHSRAQAWRVHALGTTLAAMVIGAIAR